MSRLETVGRSLGLIDLGLSLVDGVVEVMEFGPQPLHVATLLASCGLASETAGLALDILRGSMRRRDGCSTALGSALGSGLACGLSLFGRRLASLLIGIRLLLAAALTFALAFLPAALALAA